ncbi:DUF378 domain-containing protein [bacterium]|nr:DUF378 domain-containing protein [bacterium]
MHDPMTMYYHKKLYMIVIFLVLVGSINWLSIGATGQDLVRLVLPLKYARWLYIVIGLGAIPLLFQRDVYLPFLGEMVLPAGAMSEKTPQNANDQVTIRTRPGAKVVYWAAEPDPNQGRNLPTFHKAYSEYENSGVVVADTSGHAILRFRGPPQAYAVPFKGRLEPHVHFRVEEANGLFGRVQTLFVKSGHVEGFADML